MSRYILICSCFNMHKKASESFSLLFPNDTLPAIIKGRDRIYKLAQSIKNDHLLAIAKLSGRFAYYVKLEEGKVVEEWDLVKGKRIA